MENEKLEDFKLTLKEWLFLFKYAYCGVLEEYTNSEKALKRFEKLEQKFKEHFGKDYFKFNL